MIKKLGPLKPVRAIRGEAKHMELKRIAQSTCNKINLRKTVAMRMQIGLCARFQKKRGLISNIELGTVDRRPFITLNFDNQFSELFKSHERIKHFYLKGITYKLGMVLNMSNQDAPHFGRIECMFADSHNNCSDIIFILNELETMNFNEEIQALRVNTKSEKYVCIKLFNISNKFASDIVFTSKSDAHVVLKE